MSVTPEQGFSPALKALQESHWEDFLGIVKSISDLQQREELWAALGRAHDRDIDLVATLLSWPAAKAALRYLAPALAYAKNLSTVQVLSVFQVGAAAGAEAGYRVPEILKKVFEGDSQLPVQVGDALRQDAQALTDGRWSQWASSFTQASPEAAARYASSMPQGSEGDRTALALLLERLPCREPAVQAALSAGHEALTEALLKEAPHEGVEFSVYWSALCRLAEFSEEAAQSVLDAAGRGERPAVIALANWVHGHASLEVGATRTPLTEVLELLLDKAIADEEVRGRAVNSCISSLLYNSALRPVAAACIEKLGEQGTPVAQLFGEAFTALADEPEALHQVLTAWLVSPTASFAAIRSILERFIGLRAPVGLNAQTFMAASPERRLAAVRRLLVLSLDGSALCSFAGLLAESEDFQPGGAELGASMLQEIFVEYPGATEDFLQEKLKAVAPGSPAAGIYQSLHQRAEKWRQVLDSLPRLGELKPTDTERLALNALRLRFGRSVSRRSEEHSILGLFASKVNMAQGRRFSSMFGPGAGQVTATGEFSHTVEWPTWQISDPLGAMIRRDRMLKASR
jgi:hypothetical protein